MLYTLDSIQKGCYIYGTGMHAEQTAYFYGYITPSAYLSMFERHVTKLIIVFIFINCIIMVRVVLHMTGSVIIYVIEAYI